MSTRFLAMGLHVTLFTCCHKVKCSLVLYERQCRGAKMKDYFFAFNTGTCLQAELSAGEL
jgi:hypothetical protein